MMLNIALYSYFHPLLSAEDAIVIGAMLEEKQPPENFRPSIFTHRFCDTQATSEDRTKSTASVFVTSKPSYNKKVDLFVDVKKMQKKEKRASGDH